MKDAMEKVRDFHLAFDIPVSNSLAFPDAKRRILRRALLQEEYLEYVNAEYNGDFVEVADALADMCVIICGTALEYGINLPAVFEEIHRSNMTKLGEDEKPTYREDGKVTKGPNFQPPNLIAALCGGSKLFS